MLRLRTVKRNLHFINKNPVGKIIKVFLLMAMKIKIDSYLVFFGAAHFLKSSLLLLVLILRS
jgi:hypothetical protein